MAEKPIIVIKRSASHRHAHHGGSWKVAYADFVTAMMAFFLVMWIVGQNNQLKHSVAQYFRDPGVWETTRGGLLPGSNGTPADIPRPAAGAIPAPPDTSGPRG